MLGAAIARRLANEVCEIPRTDRSLLDLRCQTEVKGWMPQSRPDVVIVAAATVGGIEANRRGRADFLHDNLSIASAVLKAAPASGVRKLTFLSSSCVYPRLAARPLLESSLHRRVRSIRAHRLRRSPPSSDTRGAFYDTSKPDGMPRKSTRPG